MKEPLKNGCQEVLVAGTKKGVCSFCKEIKMLLLFRYGIVICECCLSALTQILELAYHGVSEEGLRCHFKVEENEE